MLCGCDPHLLCAPVLSPHPPHPPAALQQPTDPELPPSASKPANSEQQTTTTTPKEAARRETRDRLQELRAAQESLHTRFNEMHRELGPQAMNLFAEVNQQERPAVEAATPASPTRRLSSEAASPAAEPAGAAATEGKDSSNDATLTPPARGLTPSGAPHAQGLTPPAAPHAQGLTPPSAADSSLPLRLAFSPDDVVVDSEAAIGRISEASDSDDSDVDSDGHKDLAAALAKLDMGAEVPPATVASTPKRSSRSRPPSTTAGKDAATAQGAKAASATSGAKATRHVLPPTARAPPSSRPKSQAAKNLFGGGAANSGAAEVSTPSGALPAANGLSSTESAAAEADDGRSVGGSSTASASSSDSSASDAQSRASSPPQSPDLSRMDEVFEACFTYDLMHINRLGQAAARMIEVTGNSRLAILNNDNGSEIDRFDLQLLVNVSRQDRAARPVLQLTFVHALGDEQVLRLTYVSEDDEDVAELNNLQEVVEKIATENRAARAHENVAIRTKCIACQHVLDAEERRFLVDERRECPVCGSSEVYDLNINEAAEGDHGRPSAAVPVPAGPAVSSGPELVRSPQNSPGLTRRPSTGAATPRRPERPSSAASGLQRGAAADAGASGLLGDLGEGDEGVESDEAGNAEVRVGGRKEKRKSAAR